MREASHRPILGHVLSLLAAAALVILAPPAGAQDGIQYWAHEFPKGDFSKHVVPFSDIRSDGARRDEIAAIHKPRFEAASRVKGIGPLEPVLRIEHFGDIKAYPLRLLIWHEIVNDRLGDTPVVATYSPLTGTAAIYERRVQISGKAYTISLGNTGRLRHFGMLMYDHQSESWWQQFDGAAIVGRFTGTKLKPLPARVESFGRFRESFPDGEVLIPGDAKARPYGQTPFIGMDTSAGTGLERYVLSPEVKPYDRVVAVGGIAWTLKLLRKKGTIEQNGLVITWTPGQNSAHDTKWISFGRDIGNVIVRRQDLDTEDWEDVPHIISFAYAYQALTDYGTIYSYLPEQ